MTDEQAALCIAFARDTSEVEGYLPEAKRIIANLRVGGWRLVPAVEREAAEAALARVEERVGALEWESLGHGRYIWRARVLAIIAEERGDG
jgi:hypothetical protein